MNPASWNYGNVSIGSRSSKDFTVQNTGLVTLDVTSTPLGGTNAGEFAITSGGGAFALAPNATQTVSVRVAPTSAGTKTATLRFASTDPNENPKDIPLSAMGVLIQLPDLVVSAQSAPAKARAGALISVTDITAKQAGTSPARASITKLYLSTNNTSGAGDVLLRSRAVPALAPGATHLGTTAVTIPAGTAAGTYYLTARADANHVVPETIESNNNRARAIRIGPDLIVTALNARASAVAGSRISVSDTTRNNGGGEAGATRTRYYLSVDTILGSSDVLLGGRAVASLAAGAANSGAATVTIPAGTRAGAYNIIAVADGTTVVLEIIESTNSRSRAITITP